MLCGSNSAKMEKLRLNKLSTFGLLRQLKQPEVVTLIDLLIANGCLDQEEVNRFRPVLRLTPLGGDVMRGKADVPGLNLPRDLRLKLRRPVAKESAPPKTEEQAVDRKPPQADEPPACERPMRQKTNGSSAWEFRSTMTLATVMIIHLRRLSRRRSWNHRPQAGTPSPSLRRSMPSKKSPSSWRPVPRLTNCCNSGRHAKCSARAEELLARLKDGCLNAGERAELERIEHVERMMVLVSANPGRRGETSMTAQALEKCSNMTYNCGSTNRRP